MPPPAGHCAAPFNSLPPFAVMAAPPPAGGAAVLSLRPAASCALGLAAEPEERKPNFSGRASGRLPLPALTLPSAARG